jgi:hypothetical protein
MSSPRPSEAVVGIRLRCPTSSTRPIRPLGEASQLIRAANEYEGPVRGVWRAGPANCDLRFVIVTRRGEVRKVAYSNDQ